VPTVFYWIPLHYAEYAVPIFESSSARFIK
jgi:hypothetical protein